MGAKLHLISTPPAEGPATRELDVVFVHGLGGDPFSTWRHGEDDTTSWPHWLAEDYGERIAVWSFGYPASKSTAPRLIERLKKFLGFSTNEDAGFSMPLPRRGRNALHNLVNNDIGNRPCIFIAHSLGGLLVKTILRASHTDPASSDERRVISNCKGVLFLATPHLGSSLATLYSGLHGCFPSITINELKADDAHLEELNEWYRGIVQKYCIQTRSFAESRPTGNPCILVVPPASANPGIDVPYGKKTVYLDVDHLQISRPEERDSDVIEEARKLINAQLNLNPKPLKVEVSDSTIPDLFPGADFHLKVTVEETVTGKLRQLSQGPEGGAFASLSCKVRFSLYQGQAVLPSSGIFETNFPAAPLSFRGDDPQPLLDHVMGLLQRTLSHCKAHLEGNPAPLRLHLHLMLPLAWLSGPLPEMIQRRLRREVFFGCSKREEVAESAVTQLRAQAMQINQRLHSGGALVSLDWATVCHGEPATGLHKLFHPSAQVIHLSARDLDGEADHSDLVGRDALLATDPGLLFTKRFSSAGMGLAEESVRHRWAGLVKIGLPLVLWWRADGTKPLNIDLGPVLQGSWSEFCGHLQLLPQVLNRQDESKLAMRALMENLGIFYEEPLRCSPPDSYRHPRHASP